MVQKRASPRKLHIGVYAEAKDVIGNSLEPQSIPRIVRNIDIRNALILLAKTCWLVETQGDISKVQSFLAQQLLGPTIVPRAIRLITVDERVLFFKPQIHVLMKYVACFGRVNDEDMPLDQADIKRLGLALIAVNDLISLEVKRSKQKIVSRDEIEYVTLELFTGAYFVPSPTYLLSFVRAKQMLVNIHGRTTASTHPAYVDINQEFTDAVGVSLGDYLSIGIGIAAYFFGNDRVDHDLNALIFDPRQWLSTTSLSGMVVDRLLATISSTLTDFTNAVQAQDRREMTFDFLCMKNKPLLQIAENKFLLFSLPYLIEKLTTGTYWMLFDFLGQTRDEETKLKFSAYNGYLFQEYIVDLARQIYAWSQSRGEKLVVDQTYRVGKQEQRTPDVMFFGNDYAVFIEVSATRIQARKSISLGDIKAIRGDFEKMLFANAKSLNTCIENFRSRKWSVEGVDPDKITRFYPVIVLIEGFPQFPVVYKYLAKELNARSVLTGAGIARLSVLDAQDIETVAGFGNMTLVDALLGWHTNVEFPNVSLEDYLGSVNKAKSKDWFLKSVNDTFGEATKLLLGMHIQEVIDQAESKD